MVVDVHESETVESGFELRLKNYRILEGSGVTFHCKMTGYPLPKVCMHMPYTISHPPKQVFLHWAEWQRPKVFRPKCLQSKTFQTHLHHMYS